MTIYLTIKSKNLPRFSLCDEIRSTKMGNEKCQYMISYQLPGLHITHFLLLLDVRHKDEKNSRGSLCAITYRLPKLVIKYLIIWSLTHSLDSLFHTFYYYYMTDRKTKKTPEVLTERSDSKTPYQERSYK